MLIYCFTDRLTNELLYVGSTKNKLSTRMRGHRADCIKYPTWNIYERVTRIGWKNVDVSILEEGFEGTPEELRWQERRYIEELNPTCNDNRPIVSKEDILEGSRQRSLSYYYRNRLLFLKI